MPSEPDSNSVTGLLRNGGVRGYVGMTANTDTRRGAWKAPTVVEHFMKALFRRRAFRGAGPEAASCAPCRFRQTMTAVDTDAGRVIVQIGFAPFRPAEFVIFRIRDSVTLERGVAAGFELYD